VLEQIISQIYTEELYCLARFLADAAIGGSAGRLLGSALGTAFAFTWAFAFAPAFGAAFTAGCTILRMESFQI